jgi:hypothetical protein
VVMIMVAEAAGGGWAVRSEEIGSGLWPVASGYLSASAVDISGALARFRSRKSANVGEILYTAFSGPYARAAYRSTPMCGTWAEPVSGGWSSGRTTTGEDDRRRRRR